MNFWAGIVEDTFKLERVIELLVIEQDGEETRVEEAVRMGQDALEGESC